VGVSGSTAGPLRVIDEISGILRPEPLDSYRGELVALVGLLLADGVDPLEVTRVVGTLNDALTARLIGLAEAELGPPPCRHAWLALGSQGRGEQVLSSDQDSALAYEGVGADQDAADYFGPMADLVVAALARAGLALCPGGYMATTWCHPIDEYRRLFRGWVEYPEPDALLRAEIFLDLRPVHGDLPVDVLDAALASGALRPRFRVMLARAAVTFRPPIGVFGRLRVEHSAIDVKRAGIAAIVLLARLYALAAGSPARTTVLRLEAAATAGWMTRARADGLTEAYRFLTGLRLRHQLEQARRDEPTDNVVPLAALTAPEQRRLRDALRGVRDLQDMTASLFATHTVM
jgi:CBS domain-containing protein